MIVFLTIFCRKSGSWVSILCVFSLNYFKKYCFLTLFCRKSESWVSILFVSSLKVGQNLWPTKPTRARNKRKFQVWNISSLMMMMSLGVLKCCCCCRWWWWWWWQRWWWRRWWWWWWNEDMLEHQLVCREFPSHP